MTVRASRPACQMLADVPVRRVRDREPHAAARMDHSRLHARSAHRGKHSPSLRLLLRLLLAFVPALSPSLNPRKCTLTLTSSPRLQKIKVLRVVVREDLSRSRCDTLIRDLKAAIDYLEKAPAEVQKHLSNKSQAAGETTSEHHAVAHRNRHAVHLHEKHSLGGKYGKTHAVWCVAFSFFSLRPG